MGVAMVVSDVEVNVVDSLYHRMFTLAHGPWLFIKINDLDFRMRFNDLDVLFFVYETGLPIYYGR